MVFDQINLSTHERIDHRVRYVAFGGMAIVVIVLSLFNLAKGYQVYRERTTYQEKIDQLRQQKQKLQATASGRGAISTKDFQRLMNEGLEINRLIALDLFPWVKILDAIEQALPEAVILDAFRPDENFERVYLSGHTDSLEKLVRFQERLEDAELFTSVVLQNMGLGQGGQDQGSPNSRSQMKFELHCRLQLDQILPTDTNGGLWKAIKKSAR